MHLSLTPKPKFLEILAQKVIVYDGAMGTNLFNYNLTADDYGGAAFEGCPEMLNKTKPEIIQEIHRNFFSAGADIVETNSFGSSRLVLGEYGISEESYEISKLAARLAREVADEFTIKEPEKPRFVAGSIGPGTKLATLGNVHFDELKNSYLDQVQGLIDGGVDVILIETCQDPLQIKAVLVACYEIFSKIEEEFKDKTDEELLAAYPRGEVTNLQEFETFSNFETSSNKTTAITNQYRTKTGLSKRFRLPLQVQITIEQTGTMLVGTDLNAALTIIAAYPIDIFGMNCATGPKEMQEHIQYLKDNCPVKISCLPNAGIPENVCGHAHFPLGPDEFTSYLSKFITEYQVNIVGGCCGTSYQHIKQLADAVKDLSAPRSDTNAKTQEVRNSLSSLYSAINMDLDTKPIIVGERTNANGSKLFKDLLANEDYDAIIDLAKEQVEEGAQILDLCAAYVGRNEIRDMKEILFKLNTAISIPIMVDSTEADVLEESLKLISGKAVVNSVNLEDGEDRVELIAKLCNRYGAALVVLTIDESGMAKTAKKKLEVAERLYDLLVNQHGMNANDIIFDTLTFTLGSGDEEFRKAGIETIEAIRLIKEKMPEVKSILGVSNISFGLDPKLRTALNSVFMHEATKAGLDMAIVNNKKIIPLHKIENRLKELCLDLIYDRRIFKDNGECSFDPLMELLALVEDIKLDDNAKTNPYEGLSVEQILSQRIIDGNKTNIDKDLDLAREKGHKPLDIINQFLMDGMKIVGERFGAGEMQLPFVLQSATTMKAAVSHLEQFMDKVSANTHKGSLVLATVKGDVHDIGKNLVDIILSNNGYKVYNLGIKQPIEEIIKAIEEHKPDLLALSGLLVKSTLIMKQNLEVLNDRGIDLPVILGGAALTRRFVEQDCANIYKGTVFYGYDAFTDLDIMERLSSKTSLDEIKKEFYKTKPSAENTNSAYQEVGDSDEDSYAPLLSYTENLSSVPALKNDAIPVIPFYGDRIIDSTEIDLDEMWSYLNLDAMIIGQWRMGKGKRSDEEYKAFLDTEVYPVLERLKAETRKNPWFKPQIIYGYYYCKIDETNPNQLNIYSEDKTQVIDSFIFPRQNKDEYLCLSDYFRLEDTNSFNIVPFQLVTIGVSAAEFVNKLYQAGEFSEYLYYYGLATESTEALAEYAHARIRKELGFSAEDDKDTKKLLRGSYHGMRFSFGYPACPRLEDQLKLFELFKPDRIGMKLSDEWQIHPEHSTSAIVIHHPAAKYYNVKIN